MKAYLVFGDPRRPERRAVFMRAIALDDLRLHGNTAWLTTGSATYEGGLLGNSPDPAKQNGSGEPYVSVLISEDRPTVSVANALHRDGWQEVSDYPPPTQLPFLVQVTLLVPSSQGLDAWTKPMWFPHAFVPTQRSVLTLEGTADVPVQCLSMLLHRDTRHEAFFVALPSTSEDLSFLRFDNWTRTALAGDDWPDMMALGDAVEATVVYVLGATVVDGVVLHDADALANLSFSELLPGDVLEETVLALYEAGREDLVPQHLRIPPPNGAAPNGEEHPS